MAMIAAGIYLLLSGVTKTTITYDNITYNSEFNNYFTSPETITSIILF